MGLQFKKLSAFLKETNVKESIDNSVEYKCGGVRLNGMGIFVREIKLGSDIKKQWVMHKVKENNVIYSTLFADKGAFAIATKKDEDLIFSEKFVSFEIIDPEVLPEYLHVVFQTDYLSSQCNEFKTGMAAFSLSHSSKKKVLNLSIPVPDKPAQIRIVKEYEAYEKCRVKLEDEADNLLSSAQAVIKRFVMEHMEGVETTPLVSLGKYINRPIELTPGEMYKQITVKLHGNGVVLRKLEDGGNIKSKQFVVKTNDLIYSKIDVKSGAIGFIPSELEGGVVTADFPLIHMPDITEIDRNFLMIYFSSEQFCEKMEDKSKGTTNRVRTKKSAFLDTVVPWGTDDYRRETVLQYKILCRMLDDLCKNAIRIQEDAPKLTSKYLNNLLGIS